MCPGPRCGDSACRTSPPCSGCCAFALAARGAVAAARLRRRAEPRAHPPPGRLPRGRGDAIAAISRPWVGVRRSPYHRLVLALERRIFTLRPRGTSSPSRAGTPRRSAGSTARRRMRLTVVYNGVDLERFHPRSRGAPPPSDARGARPAGRRLARAVRGHGLRAQGARPADRGARAARRPARGPRRGRARATPRRISARADAPRTSASRVDWLGPRPDVERLVRDGRRRRAAHALRAVRQRAPRGARVGAARADEPSDGRRRDRRSRAERLGGRRARSRRRSRWACEALRALDPARARAAARKAAEPFTYAAQVDAFLEIYRRLER